MSFETTDPIELYTNAELMSEVLGVSLPDAYAILCFGIVRRQGNQDMANSVIFALKTRNYIQNALDKKEVSGSTPTREEALDTWENSDVEIEGFAEFLDEVREAWEDEKEEELQ